jgi:hypothetical protein
VTCDYWTWGQPVKALAARLDEWEKHYYGAITATF